MRSERKEIYWLAALLLTGFTLRVMVSMTDIVRLVQICLADDAFYYFRIAKNIAAGLGATADRVHPTNGFHPLYMTILVPIFTLFGHDLILPVRIALVILSLFNTLTAVYIYKILRRLCNGSAGLLGAAFFLYNPAAVFTCLTGVEASISAFFIAAATDTLLKIKDTESPAWKDTLVLGAFLGLALVARTDSIIFCGCVFLDRTICACRKNKNEWLRLSITAGVAGLMTVPWIGWNMARFHSIQQNSGKTIQFMHHRLLENAYPAENYARMLIFSMGETAYKAAMYLREFYLPFYAPGVILITCLALLLATFFLGLHRLHATKRYLTHLYPLFLTMGILFLFYSTYFLFCQRWYFMSSFFIGSLIWGPALWYIAELTASLTTHVVLRRVMVSALSVLLAVCVWWSYKVTEYVGYNPWQALYIQAGKFIEERLPEGTTVGAFNSGIISYFTNKKVVNLDGVVNSDIYQVLKDRRLMAYIRDNDIEFVIDHLRLFTIYEYFSDAPFGDNLAFVVAFKSWWWGLGDMLLFKVTQPPLTYRAQREIMPDEPITASSPKTPQ